MKRLQIEYFFRADIRAVGPALRASRFSAGCSFFDGRLEILEWAKLRSWSMIERARDLAEGELTEPLIA